MVEFNRKEFIQFALDYGKNSEQINNALVGEGHQPLTPYESRLIEKDRYNKNILQRLGGDIAELGKGMSTILSAGANYAVNPEFRAVANEKLRNITPSDIGEVLTSNYNYNPAMFAVDPVKGIKQVLAGIGTEPGFFLLDLAPAVGAGVRGAVKGAKAITKGVKGTGNVADTVKTLNKIDLPTNNVVNEILNVSREAPVKGVNELRKAYSNINAKYSLDDIQGALRNLEIGTEAGTKTVLNATKDIKEFSKQVNKIMQELGVNPTKAEEVATLQNISRRLEDEKGLKINLEDIRKFNSGDKDVVKRFEKLGIDTDTLSQYQKDAKELFEKGFITPVRHSTRDVYKKGDYSLNTPEDFAKGVLAERRYGTQSYENLAKGFNEGGYEPLLKELEKSKQVTTALDEIINTIGKKVTPDALPQLAKGEVYVSKQFINDVVGSSLEAGGKTSDAVRNALRSFSDNVDNLPADDIYVMRKKDLNALENAFVSDKKLKNAGWFHNLSSIGKQNALATLRYIAGNELANVTSNFATGTNIGHYLRAIREGSEGIPEALKRSSSYQGYLGNDLDVNKAVSALYKEMWNNFKTGKEGSVAGRLKLAQSMANYPIFRSASMLETLDRSASFFKNAEKVAKEIGKNAEDVIKEAKANGGNNPTYREIKRRIDNDLGDYVGHNYYLDPRIEEVTRLAIPFYRPFTQSARILANVAQNYPAFYQSQIKLPSIAGNRFTKAGEEVGVTPDEEYGGFPIRARFGNVPSKVMVNPYHNVTPIGEIAGGFVGSNPELLPSVNTFGVAPYLALMGLNKYGKQATLPGTYNINGRQITVDNNGNPIVSKDNIMNRVNLVLAQTGQTYVPGVNTINQTILPVLANIAKQDYRSPSDYSIFGQIGDKTIPVLSQGGKTARVTKEEKLLPVFGFSYRQTYKDNDKLKLRDIKALRRKQYIEQLRNER